VGAEFTIKAGEKVLGAVPLQNVNALPGPSAASARFIARLNLAALPKGNYTLEAKIHDLARNTSTTQATDFQLE
jgi:hypothetical protein